MPNEINQGQDNKTTGAKPSGTGAASGAGMQVSGEEIFLPEDKQPKVTKESDVFGQQTGGQKPAQPQTQGAPPAQSAQPKQPNQSDVKPPAGNAADDAAKQASKQVNQVLSGDLKPVTEAFSQARDTAGAVASQVYEKAQDKAETVITEQKKSLAQGLGSVAENIRKFGDTLNSDQSNPIGSTAAKYGSTVAEQVENLSHYIERGDFRTFASDLQSFARRNPTAFVAGAFGLGLLAARFIKSSPRNAAPRNLGTGGGSRAPLNSGSANRGGNAGKAANAGNNKGDNDKDAATHASSPTI